MDENELAVANFVIALDRLRKLLDEEDVGSVINATAELCNMRGFACKHAKSGLRVFWGGHKDNIINVLSGVFDCVEKLPDDDALDNKTFSYQKIKESQK